MDDHPRILQQRIQVAAFDGRRQQALERIAGEDQEGEEAERDPAHHAEHAREHAAAAATVENSGDRRSPQRQDQRPQQQRAFVRAPDRGVAVDQRQQRVGIRRDVAHREVLHDEGVRQDREGRCDERELRRRPAAARSPSTRRCRAARRPAAARPAAQRRSSARISAIGRVRAALSAYCPRRARRRPRARRASGAPRPSCRRLPSACRSRRAWPALRRRRRSPSRMRPVAITACFRGTGPEGCPCRRTGSVASPSSTAKCASIEPGARANDPACDHAAEAEARVLAGFCP